MKQKILRQIKLLIVETLIKLPHLLIIGAIILVSLSQFVRAESISYTKPVADNPAAMLKNPHVALFKFTAFVSINNNDLEKLKKEAKDVVGKLVSKDYEGVRQNFNEEMKKGLTVEKMKEVWEAVILQIGNYKSQGDAYAANAEGYDVVVIRCQMERGAVTVEVDYDSSGKIGGLWVRPAN